MPCGSVRRPPRSRARRPAGAAPRLVLQMVALVQNQSHEEVAGVAGVNEEPRHEFLATELPVGEPLEGLTLDLG